MGYRYFDTFGVMPLYCFGYGKSYTEFEMKTINVTADEKQVQVEVEVTNIGDKYPGKEVVQVYYSAPDGIMEKPTQELAGFAKTKLLAPGEKDVVTITFATINMASFDAYDAEITTWGRKDLKDVDDSNLGLAGSPTQIAKASDKVRKGKGVMMTAETAEEGVEYIMDKLLTKHVI